MVNAVAAGHVFAAVVAHALDHGDGAGIAHGEALARLTADVGLAAGRAVERHIAHDDVLVRGKARVLRREQHQPAAGETLAEVVVAVACEADGHALGQERAEGLAAAALRVDGEGVLGQSASVQPRDLAAEDGSEGAVGAGDGQGDALRLGARQVEFLEQHALVQRLLRLKVERVLGNAMLVDVLADDAA